MSNSATDCFEYLQLEVTKLGEQELHCGFHILLEGTLTVLCDKWGQSLQVLLHVSHEPLLVESWLLLTNIGKNQTVKTRHIYYKYPKPHNNSIIANSIARYGNCTFPSIELPAV